MREVMYRAFCLDCSADYVEDLLENLATCRECDSDQVEWEGFEV